MLHRKSLLYLFFSSPSCHSALHCPFLSIVSLPVLILILQPKAFITSFTHITELFECIQEASRKKKILIGTGAIKPGDVAGSRLLSERWSRRLRLMAETRPDCIALVLKGCEAVTTARSHLLQSGDSQLEQWRLQLHVLPTWVASGSQ